MTIILLTPQNLIAPESAFHWEPGGTVMDAFVLPRTAGEMLGLREPTPIKAIAGKLGYAFWWRGKNWRAVTDIPGAPVPLVLTAIEVHEHWNTCKECRDGQWCATGTELIIAAVMEGNAS